jgi:ATP-dependent Clp protease ATP-binding subunit ClpC
VEWESSAIDFLLKKGFTEDLGARPLKRSVERHLLSPLATTIVNHQFPEGDQFLFVRSDGEEIEVAFVDPDEHDEMVYEETEPRQLGDEPPRIRDLVLSSRGDAREVDLLQENYNFLKELMEEDRWIERKASLMEAMNHPDFWKSEERFLTLGKVEYIDRIEEGFRTAGSLLERLAGGANARRNRYSISLIKRIAQRVYLVEEAARGLEEGAPRDAYVLIETRRTPPRKAGAEADFALRLKEMYTQWAKRRGMQCEVLTEVSGGGDQAYRAVLAVSGFGAYPILSPEQGIHEMEVPGSRDKPVHFRVHVRVISQPEETVFGSRKSELTRAERALAESEPDKLPVVRRYREEPSPLVRDSVRKFRTGRIDLVWRGDFDLLQEVTSNR